MSTKHKKKKVSLATFKSPGVELAPAQVDDPYEPGKKLRVVKNTRVHPLDHMQAAGSLTKIQKKAGDRFLEIFDRAELGGARAIDYSRVKVDVSFMYAGLNEDMAAAVQQLSGIYHALGERAYALLAAIIGLRKAPFDFAREAGGAVNREMCAHVTASFKEALDDLARHFGFTGRKGAPRVKFEAYERKVLPMRPGSPIAIRVENGRIILADA